jgi:GR25 family glycosyltransferase involved in LPS biosynthesis
MNITDIDKVYIINLTHRKDRYDNCIRLIEKLTSLQTKVAIFPAVNGKDIINNSKLKNGELGCSMSHAKIWKEAKLLGYNYVLILEDDVIFDVDFEEKLNTHLINSPSHFDWIYLYNSWDYRPVEDFDIYYFKVIASLGTVAYVINVQAIDRILPFVEEFEFPVDVVMGHMSFLSKVYRTKIEFIKHDYESQSEIRQPHRNRIVVIKNRLANFFKI